MYITISEANLETFEIRFACCCFIYYTYAYIYSYVQLFPPRPSISTTTTYIPYTLYYYLFCPFLGLPCCMNKLEPIYLVSQEYKKNRENLVTHLSLVHLLFLGGKEPKKWVGNNGFSPPKIQVENNIRSYFPPIFLHLEA